VVRASPEITRECDTLQEIRMQRIMMVGGE